MGIDAKMVVAAMTATGHSVCDPKDRRQVDISGFDSTCPQFMADFSAGRV
jgi:60 kDa SS-A/Ro ribonucleoprotein